MPWPSRPKDNTAASNGRKSSGNHTNNHTAMQKKTLITAIIISVLTVGIGIMAYLLIHQKQKNEEYIELAELDKKELENQYTEFNLQYQELQKSITNDSLIAQIEVERRHTQQLLQELKDTKATDAAEIARLKKEIESLRKVLRTYVAQVDSLMRINQDLTEENKNIRAQYTRATDQISQLSTERNELKDKVDLAAQLDATGFWVTPKKKRGKETQKAKDVKQIAFGFTISKNDVTQNGERTVYARIMKPDNTILQRGGGTFKYEDQELQYSIKKYIQYDGKAQSITLYWDVDEYMAPGTYKIFIFVDGQMIGETAFTLK